MFHPSFEAFLVFETAAFDGFLAALDAFFGL